MDDLVVAIIGIIFIVGSLWLTGREVNRVSRNRPQTITELAEQRKDGLLEK